MSVIEKHIIKLKKKILSEDVEDGKLYKCLKELYYLPIDTTILKSTGIGKAVNHSKKKEGKIGELARQLVKKWKDFITEEETTKQSKKSTLKRTSLLNSVPSTSHIDLQASESRVIESPAVTDSSSCISYSNPVFKHMNSEYENNSACNISHTEKGKKGEEMLYKLSKLNTPIDQTSHDNSSSHEKGKKRLTDEYDPSTVSSKQKSSKHNFLVGSSYSCESIASKKVKGNLDESDYVPTRVSLKQKSKLNSPVSENCYSPKASEVQERKGCSEYVPSPISFNQTSSKQTSHNGGHYHHSSEFKEWKEYPNKNASTEVSSRRSSSELNCPSGKSNQSSHSHDRRGGEKVEAKVSALNEGDGMKRHSKVSKYSPNPATYKNIASTRDSYNPETSLKSDTTLSRTIEKKYETKEKKNSSKRKVHDELQRRHGKESMKALSLDSTQQHKEKKSYSSGTSLFSSKQECAYSEASETEGSSDEKYQKKSHLSQNFQEKKQYHDTYDTSKNVSLADECKVMKKETKKKVPTVQLCDIDFGAFAVSSEKPKKTKKKPKAIKPDSTSVDVTQKSLPPVPTSEIEASLLPEICPDYKPSRFSDLSLWEANAKKRKGKKKM